MIKKRSDFGHEPKPQTPNPKPYYATFIPGLQLIISDVLKERLKDVTIHKLLDGAVLFETETSYDKLNFFCFNNIFAVIDVKEKRSLSQQGRNASRGDAEIEWHVEKVINKSERNNVITENNKKFKTFRMVFSCENVPVAVNEKLRVEIEKYIARLSKLKVNRSNPDTEFWFLLRKEKDTPNFSVFMKRLTLHASWEKTLHKGELLPPLAWTLCRLAGLVHSDTVLDPFCGYGSIPLAALKHFHIKNFIACDNNKEAASFLKARFKTRTKNDFVFYQNDYSLLPELIGEKSIDVIITDPPWGHFSKIDGSVFYKKMFKVFSTLLKDNGRAVVLCANKEDLLNAAAGYFTLLDSTPILLSGKKAIIYQLEIRDQGSGIRDRYCCSKSNRVDKKISLRTKNRSPTPDP